ncbi:hypothetical protein GOP47_0017415 [Adiantum capillus-veneris]|uniref:HhH-GPD domain-containing protein n=1 Tax=Adiantum capillus-veneris TaxID=13818 RepID=A0A9D4UFR7_ADICA|nr:hypothetical protein GOP47_0017415 [Adiantum capillus-veneris]
MAKTKAHAKRKELSEGTGECDKTMSYYNQHYQDEKAEGETNRDVHSRSINNAEADTKGNPAMQSQMNVEKRDELPDWRMLCSSHMQSYLSHHKQDELQYGISSVGGEPPVIVYYRRRRKKPISTNVQPSRACRNTVPRPHTPLYASRKQSSKKGKKKTSKNMKKIQMKGKLQFKAGQMVLRKTTARIKRSLADTKLGKTANSKGKLRQTPSTSRVKVLPQGKSGLQRGNHENALSEMHPKAQNNRKYLPNHQSSAILSQGNNSKAFVGGKDKGTSNKATVRDSKVSRGPSSPMAKTKRKKHRPKVQEIHNAPRGRKPSFGLHKTQGRKQQATNVKKRGRKKENILPSHMEDLLGSFCVVSGCPEVLNIIPCPWHRDDVKALPALQSTKDTLIICIHNPSNGKEISSAEASSSASNEVCQQVDASNSQLVLAPQLHHPSTTPNTSTQIVLYDRRREIVLFKVPKGMKSVRPKVPISAENERIWPLLAQGGIPNDNDDTAYWEKERSLMKERVKDFILRMHGVQGDRRFSPWKGSVLDSVVGAFLTQNVLDHLSSSAFMSIASQYPPRKREYTYKATSEAQSPIETNSATELFNKKEAGTTASHSQDNKIKRPSRLHSAPAALDSLKKRKLSHISGIERAHIEENLNGWKKNSSRDWESMRRQTLNNPSRHNQSMPLHENSVDWDTVRHSKVEDLAKAIKERGMHHVLSGRIKALLKALDEEHGSIDLEWLRELSPENARAYLMSIHGLNVKSTECIRLLTLHHVAFPVDVHVGRICVRLGWVPIEPLPEQLQLHLLDLYPLQETVQKYLWPRLCTLDQKTLYEFHYQLITFGKVFCTKSRPNCNACPMQKGCKHFASAYSSAKLLLPGPTIEETIREETQPLTFTMVDNESDVFPCEDEYYSGETPSFSSHALEPHDEEDGQEEEVMDIEDFPYNQTSLPSTYTNMLETSLSLEIQTNTHAQSTCPPLLGESHGDFSTKECSTPHVTKDSNIRCYSQRHCCNDLDYIEAPSSKRKLTFEETSTNAIISLQTKQNVHIPQLKKATRSCTMHYVYEIPDMHPLLDEVEPRRKDDPSSYLLAIWSPGEVPLTNQDQGILCDSSSPKGEDPNEVVSGTLLIPCKTALQGSFPLNGTYFQVNEVFADHESSLQPFQVPRSLIWDLHRCLVYFGTSLTQIVRGFTRDEIEECFSNGYVCVRGFDRRSRAPKLLVCRLHLCESREQSKKIIRLED